MKLPLMRGRSVGVVATLASAAMVAGWAAPAGAVDTAASTSVRPASCASTVAPGYARCMAVVAGGGVPVGVPKPPSRGLGPSDLDNAYALPTSRGAGQTVGIVDAQDDPNAESDLAFYRKAYGLPACTTANGCFSKVNQRGQQRNYPAVDSGWALEISLDLDMVSAACPKCHILLVEGDSPLVSDLGASVTEAVKLGASVVSNSYGLDEFNGMRAYFKYYQHSGATIVASSGDFGFTAAQFPAVTPGVVAVGGTSLRRADNARGWTEHAWSGAGSGCSAYVPKPAYQTDNHCHMRTIADVSGDADPYTGPAVRDTVPYFGQSGWFVVGGTSASSPFIAGVIGLAGNARSLTPSYLYRHASALNDVVGGSNGFCGGDYLCTAKKGYDGPTGLGSPNGTGGF